MIFVYGALASSIAQHFFSGVDETTGFILALASFGVGFLVRPVGALVFGRIGDRLGRKSTLLATLTIMGAATLLIGFVPDHRRWHHGLTGFVPAPLASAMRLARPRTNAPVPLTGAAPRQAGHNSPPRRSIGSISREHLCQNR